MVSPPSNPTKNHNYFNGNLLEFCNATCQVIKDGELYNYIMENIVPPIGTKKQQVCASMW